MVFEREAVPELPEVETVVRDLRSLLMGRRILGVRRTSRKSLRRPWSGRLHEHLVGRRVASVQRRGKWIVCGLQEQAYLVVHLGMTGQFTVADRNGTLAHHTHLVMDLDDGRQLRYRDTRRFGSVTLVLSKAALEEFFQRSGLGPEPFGLVRGHWQRSLAATRRCIKAVLLDPRVVAGVGNIYADESLFLARLHPAHPACELSSMEAARLGRAVEKVLGEAIARRGSTIRDYVGGSGLQGGYQQEFRVYGRLGEPCRRCGTAIECMRLAGRSTHFCPACQGGHRVRAVRAARGSRVKARS